MVGKVDGGRHLPGYLSLQLGQLRCWDAPSDWRFPTGGQRIVDPTMTMTTPPSHCRAHTVGNALLDGAWHSQLSGANSAASTAPQSPAWSRVPAGQRVNDSTTVAATPMAAASAGTTLPSILKRVQPSSLPRRHPLIKADQHCFFCSLLLAWVLVVRLLPPSNGPTTSGASEKCV